MLKPTEIEKRNCLNVRRDFENEFPPSSFSGWSVQTGYNEARHHKWVSYVNDKREINLLTDRENLLCTQEFLTGSRT